MYTVLTQTVALFVNICDKQQWAQTPALNDS